ncbi:MAG: YihY/virulence factor BrkB family protein [Steroidobacteraceae bacterium]
MMATPARRTRLADLRIRLQRLPDDWLFGPAAEQPGMGGLPRRLARYPYALLRDLVGGKLNLHAMGLVYASLLAVIPLLAFSFGILRGFHAQGVLEPLVRDFFAPMGDAADALTARVMDFASKVRGGLVGSVGLALLIWTLIGAMRKIEDGFNFVWHVDQPRNLARRMAEYGALLIIGPILLAAVIGFSRLAAESQPIRALSELPLMVRFMALALRLAPYVIASGLLTLIYIVVPNTRVRLGPALAGGITAGILWAAIGRFFTLFVLYSSRLTAVYAGFAIIIATLVWTYFSWIILLLGAQVSFYAQNPGYLRVGLIEPRLSCVDLEQLALGIMYLVAERYRSGGERQAITDLATRLGYPGVAVARMCGTLEAGGYLASTADECLLPGRDPAQIPVAAILQVARAHSSGLISTATATPAAVLRLCSELEGAWLQRCAGLSLSELLDRQPTARS